MSKTEKLQREISSMQDSSSGAKAQCSLYMARTESHYLEDSAAVETRKKDMENVFCHWYDI